MPYSVTHSLEWPILVQGEHHCKYKKIERNKRENFKNGEENKKNEREKSLFFLTSNYTF